MSLIAAIARGQRGLRAGGVVEPGGAVVPIYPVPIGMTYDAATDMVDGTTIDTTYSEPAHQIAVTNAGSVSANNAALAAAIATAAARLDGATIILDAGVDYGEVRLVARSASYTGPVVIRTSAYGSLPAPCPGTGRGTVTNRVTSAHAAHLARLTTRSNNLPIVSCDDGASGYRFVGLEMAPAAGVATNTILSFTPDGWAVVDQQGIFNNDIGVDRCWIHGNEGDDRDLIHGRGVYITGGDCFVINSSITAIKGWYEGQSILVAKGPGTIKIDNNYCEGGCENIMLGGSGSYPGLIITDVQITGNHCIKPLRWHNQHPSWDGSTHFQKNLFEIKQGRRVLIEGNIFENHWYGHGSQYHAVVLKSTSQDSETPWITTEHITFRWNKILNVYGAASWNGNSEGPTVSANGGLYDIHCNLFVLGDEDTLRVSGAGTIAAGYTPTHSIGGAPRAMRITRNTYVGVRNIFMRFDSESEQGAMTVADNLFGFGTYGLRSGGGSTLADTVPSPGEGEATLLHFAPGSTLEGNAIWRNGTISAGVLAEYPNDTMAQTAESAVYTDLAGGTYTVALPAFLAATDGTAPGVDVATLDSKLAGV